MFFLKRGPQCPAGSIHLSRTDPAVLIGADGALSKGVQLLNQGFGRERIRNPVACVAQDLVAQTPNDDAVASDDTQQQDYTTTLGARTQ